MSSLFYLLGFPVPSLLLILLLGFSGARGQEEFLVLQPKDPVSVAEGEMVTLNCTVPGILPAGPVKWFKGKEPQRQEIYNFKGGTYPRITKAASSSSTTDFSISISNITPEDSGTYYCVKFKKGNPDTEVKSGGGTMLSVMVKPSVPVVSGPKERVNSEHMENFICNSMGFFPKTITLKWFKNGKEISAQWTKVFPQDNSVSYNITSTVKLKLEASDVHSKVICEVNHSTLQSPLRGTKNLSDIIRVLPKVNVSSQLFAMNYNNITCHIMEFYPKTVSVIWLENGFTIVIGKTSKPTENKDGTYSLNTSFLVNVCGQKEGQEITCQVLHDSQPPISASKTFIASSLSGTMDKKESGQGLSGQLFVIFLLGLKVLLLFSVPWLYVLRKQKKKVSEAAHSVSYSSAPDP
ncbi:signal-regulatory protein beta-1-like isoform X2 [Vombatus ursinus]|uniref:Ig-like domain-containing protein n=1 Tax=Vombatus ursinus TaxID=29139 RepID=A0A4X2JWJ9_VOMUR|nr:signal-regulatory protein beta-1-like isoform X2 [Vombatus ursinus]XP_027723636.1 signal-regulatory protein beta-1-like isoform X2 [Vombatus ursinus]